MPSSIIMPAYNAATYIAESIASVQRQTVQDWELLIVDDGSTDGTHDIALSLAANDARIRCFHQANAGVATARNVALANMSDRSTSVAFLDADDLWEPQALEVLTGALADHPDAVAAHAQGRFINSDGDLILPGEMEAHPLARQAVCGRRLVRCNVDEPTTFAVLAYRNYIANSAMIVRWSARPHADHRRRLRHVVARRAPGRHRLRPRSDPLIPAPRCKLIRQCPTHERL